MTPRALSLSLSLATLLVTGLSTTSAFAEEPSLGHFCSDHWFAMGSCRNRRWTGPELMLGLDLGASVMEEHGPFGFNEGVGSVVSPGPAWGARVGVEFFPWVALEARYLGMYNAAQASVAPGGSAGGFLTSGAAAVLRLTAPLPYVHPYIFAGAGYYDVAVVSATGSELHSSSQCGLPMGFGLDVPLTYHLSLGAEATYHYQIQESYSAVTTNGIDGGDFSTFNLVLRARL
jgi:hypothetical protein